MDGKPNEVKKALAFEWVLQIVESCHEPFHFTGADTLIDLFQKSEYTSPERVDKLRAARAKRWNFLHGILQ